MPQNWEQDGQALFAAPFSFSKQHLNGHACGVQGGVELLSVLCYSCATPCCSVTSMQWPLLSQVVSDA